MFCFVYFRRIAKFSLTVLLLSGAVPQTFASEISKSPLSNSDGETLLDTSRLELTDVVVGRVNIANKSVFDLDHPDEDTALFRLANRAHMTTRPDVIRQQLLFTSGEKFSSQALEESERLIRGNRYIQTVSIRPVGVENGAVNVEVATTDAWTLMPKLALSRSGGENKTSIGIKEMNLLGSGMAVELAFKSDVDRDSTSIKFVDNHLGDSWYRLAARYANNSDGNSKYLQLEKPFYSLNSKSSNGFSVLSNDEIGSFYDQGERLSEYRHEQTRSRLFTGWSDGLVGNFSKRITIGLAQDEHVFSRVDSSDLTAANIPANRKLIYPFVGFELLENDFEKAENHNQIGKVEDRFLGTRFSATLGVASKSAGSDRNALIVDGSAQKGFRNDSGASLILAANIGARVEDGGTQNLIAKTSARYFKRQSAKRLLYIGLESSFGHHLDLDNYYEIGGDSGLRGYPLRYQSGNKRALLTVEQRYFTDWYPFRLFKVGAAIFLDVGRVWGDSPVSSQKNELLRDVGVGLRIGNDRSGLGRMVHVDVAFPLDGGEQANDVQFLITTKKSF